MQNKVKDTKILFLRAHTLNGNKFRFFEDDMKEIYAMYEVDDHNEIRNIKSESFINYISSLYVKLLNDITTRDSIKNIIDFLPYFPTPNLDSEIIKLETRVAKHKDSFYYDFCNNGWDVCKINEEGWSIEKQSDPIFRRNNGQNAQCFPEKDANCFEEIFNFVNIDPKDQILFAITLVSYFIPDIAHPILMFSGKPGVAKTTSHTIVKNLVDPTVVMGQNLPKDDKSLLVQWRSQYALFYDNITTLTSSVSDIICRGVTGEGATARKLYTDNDEVYYNLRRCFLINGVNQPGTKPDLMQRTVQVDLETISKEKRKTESEIFSLFNGVKPKLLGSIFNIISRAMKIQKSIKLTEIPRLADFAIWGEAISRSIGFKDNKFLEELFERQEKQEKDTAQFCSVFVALSAILNNIEEKNNKRITGTATEIFEKIKLVSNYSDLKQLPRTPGSLGKKINNMKEIYEKNNIRVDTKFINGDKIYEISLIDF